MGDWSEQLNFYEVMAILVPGVCLILGVGSELGAMSITSAFTSLTFGGLAVAIVAAYATGFVLQGPAGLIAKAYWALQGGQPTDQVRLAKGRIFDAKQEQALVAQTGNADPTEAEWRGYVHLWSREARAKPGARLERMLGNYGLSRSLAAVSLVLLGVHVAKNGLHLDTWLAIWGFTAVAALYRLHTTGHDYAREALVHRLEPKA